MIRTYVKASLLMIGCLMVQAQDKLRIEDTQRWMTATGMQVAYVHVPNGIVNIEMTFDAGSSRDGKQHGVAALTGALIDSGGAKLNAEHIANQLANTGSLFSVDVGRDGVSVRVKSLAEPRYFDNTFAVFTDMLAAPRFTAEDFTRVKNQLLQRIVLRDQDSKAVAWDAFYRALYSGTSYGYPVQGTENTVRRLTAKDVVAFYGSYYCAANANLVIVGDIDLAHAKHIATTIDATLPVGQAAEPLPQAVAHTAVTRSIPFDSTQSTLLLGKLGVTPHNADIFAIRLASDVIGGGVESRLGQAVREKQGLVYGIYSQFIPMRFQGPYFMTMQTQAKNEALAATAARNVINTAVQSGVTEAELQQAKQVERSRFYSRFTTNGSIAHSLASQIYYDLPDDYLQNTIDNIDSVDLAAVNHAIRTYMTLTDISTIVVGPHAKKA